MPLSNDKQKLTPLYDSIRSNFPRHGSCGRGSAPASTDLEMPEWQYITRDLNDLPRRTTVLDLLNGAGKDGWELVMITRNNIAYLKRQVPKPSSRTSRPTTSGSTTK
jgi:hypothetical protein